MGLKSSCLATEVIKWLTAWGRNSFGQDSRQKFWNGPHRCPALYPASVNVMRAHFMIVFCGTGGPHLITWALKMECSLWQAAEVRVTVWEGLQMPLLALMMEEARRRTCEWPWAESPQWLPGRKQGPQPHNSKELDSTNNLNKLINGLFPEPLPKSQAASRHLDLSLVRP